MSEVKMPEPVGHLHSNGDYCHTRQPASNECWWPVSLFTLDDMEAYAAAKVREALAQAAPGAQEGE